MKITGIGNVQGVSHPREVVAKNRADKTRGSVDAYQPTALAGEFNLARRAILATPDVRVDRVDDVSRRINAGEYNFSAADVADSILNQLV